jgi:hypothetical protein
MGLLVLFCAGGDIRFFPPGGIDDPGWLHSSPVPLNHLDFPTPNPTSRSWTASSWAAASGIARARATVGDRTQRKLAMQDRLACFPMWERIFF